MGIRRYHPPVYYTVRSIVRFVFWFTVAMLILWSCAAIDPLGVEDVPDCEYFQYPCETPTTVYDPYGYDPYGYGVTP